MMRRHSFALFLSVSLLANAFCLPSKATFRKRRDLSDNDDAITTTESELNQDKSDDDSLIVSSEEDDDDFKQPPSSGGGSNLFSLLNLVSAFLPSLSGNNNVKKNNEYVKKVIKDAINKYQAQKIQKRQDIGDNVIDIDYATEFKPPFFQRQESDENDDNDSEGSESASEDSEENNGGEESVEQASSETGGSRSKQDSASNASTSPGESAASDDDNDSDYDEPEGDGQGGILGLLAGLSGDGESDLGSLLAAVGGIVANLSGDGVDLNAIIATGLGLFVGLLSDEGSNPGEIIASYLLTSLDTITGGGAKNNGAFFGKFLASLVKGTSAAQQKDAPSQPTQSPFIALKMDIFRAILQFGSSMIGLASGSSNSPS